MGASEASISAIFSRVSIDNEWLSRLPHPNPSPEGEGNRGKTAGGFVDFSLSLRVGF